MRLATGWIHSTSNTAFEKPASGGLKTWRNTHPSARAKPDEALPIRSGRIRFPRRSLDWDWDGSCGTDGTRNAKAAPATNGRAWDMGRAFPNAPLENTGPR